jgi:predicted metal-dependent HD superfamily phosphohydrolase
MTDIPTTLRQQWERDIAAIGATTLAAERVLADIVARHGETHRRYHGQSHLVALFDLLDLHAPHIMPGSAPRLAVWWHDLVYDPRAQDNEAKSADIARDRLDALGAKPDVVEETHRLILMTRNHWDGGSAGDGDYFLDADIAILGAPDETYDAYAAAVRQEYSFVPDDAFRAGRSKFLESVLARPRLFRTEAFESAYAPQARANIRRELMTPA